MRQYKNGLVLGAYSDIVHCIVEECRKYNPADRVILFGSVARGEYKEGKSDIDLYFESIQKTTSKLRDDINFINFRTELNSILFRYKEKNNIYIDYDILFYGKNELSKVKKSLLWESVEKDGIILYDKGAA